MTYPIFICVSDLMKIGHMVLVCSNSQNVSDEFKRKVVHEDLRDQNIQNTQTNLQSVANCLIRGRRMLCKVYRGKNSKQ